jgi:cytochrome c'
MRVNARLLAAVGAALALGVGLLAVVGPGSAAGDKPMVWKPLVPGPQMDDLVKYISQSMQETVTAGPPKEGTPKEQEDAKKDWVAKLRGSALMIAVLTATAKEGGNAAHLGTLREAALKMADEVDMEKYNDVKKDAAALATLKPNPKAEAKPDGLEEKVEVIDVMNLLRLRSKGGLGFGLKPTPGPTDGIEAKVMALAKRALPAAAMAKEADDIERMAYLMAAISDVSEAHTPKKKTGDKDPKDWATWTQDMREGSLELAEAAKAKNAAAVKTAASKLNSSCNSCHGVFRD